MATVNKVIKSNDIIPIHSHSFTYINFKGFLARGFLRIKLFNRNKVFCSFDLFSIFHFAIHFGSKCQKSLNCNCYKIVCKTFFSSFAILYFAKGSRGWKDTGSVMWAEGVEPTPMAIWKVGGSSGSDRERRLSPHIHTWAHASVCLHACGKRERDGSSTSNVTVIRRPWWVCVTLHICQQPVFI